MPDGPPIDASALTIVVHLPQPLESVAALLRLVGDTWPDAAFTDGLTRLEIPADEY